MVRRLGDMTRRWISFALAVAGVVLAVWLVGAASEPPPPYCFVERTAAIGPYVLRVWASPIADLPSYTRWVTIDRGGAILVSHEWATGFDEHTGTDINGNGTPDAIVTLYSGGAHCCFDVAAYDLGPPLRRIGFPSPPGGNSGGVFEDLEGDGILEYRTADDSFAYAYCCFAASPTVPVILRFDPQAFAYVPATFAFPAVLDDAIGRDLALAEQGAMGSVLGEWDGTSKCSVLPLVLDYLYAGRIAEAWDALARYYPFPDSPAFRAEIERVVYSSPYFARPVSR
ncbi:MAG: hypothetical protein PHU43_06010 [Candidatus Bipolaricaulis sp.]|nr:hypothetical protein [Candidatus Bipolaricaulis sp.]